MRDIINELSKVQRAYRRVACPNCGSSEAIRAIGVALITVHEDNTFALDGVDCDAESKASCGDCHYYGKVTEFGINPSDISTDF